jgi:hypothetical protein
MRPFSTDAHVADLDAVNNPGDDEASIVDPIELATDAA